MASEQDASEVLNDKQNEEKQSEDSQKLLQDLKEKTKLFFVSAKETAKSSLGGRFERIREKLREARKKQEKTNETATKSPKVVMGLSSVEFAKHQESKTPCYPVIGACVVCLPYALRGTGVTMGIVLLISGIIMVNYCEILLAQASCLADEPCVPKIARNLFGTLGCILVFFLSMFYSAAVITTYNILLAETLTKLTHNLITLNHEFHRKVIVLLVSTFIIPISLTSNARRITRLSLFSLVSATVITVLVAVKLFTFDTMTTANLVSGEFNTNFLQSVAIICFMLSCQHPCRLNFVTVEQNTEAPPSNNKPANVVTAYSILCTFAIAICGYATFGLHTQSNILEDYCTDDQLACVSRVLFALGILGLYPIETQNVRYLVQQAVMVNKKVRSMFNFVITITLLVPTLLIATLVNCAAPVVEMAGYLFAIPLVFVLPAALFMRLNGGFSCSWKKLPCLISMATGVTVSLSGLTLAMFKPSECVHRSMTNCNASAELLGPLITLSSLNVSHDRN